MTITERLMELDPSLILHNEAEWSYPITDARYLPSEYYAFNNGGVECETGEFLYGMIRLMKPEFVLETGMHHGVGASYMGLALKDNKKGILHTLEFLEPNYTIAVRRIDKTGLSNNVVPYLQDVATFIPKVNYDMIFLDTEPQTRFAELIKFYPYLEEGGYIFIHDLHPHMHQIPNEEHGFAWPYGPLPEAIKYLVDSDMLRPFHFRTPRGLTGFYKVAKDDYKWKK